MADFESICTVLSAVAKAIHVYRKNNNAPTLWESEREFCSTLESTLEGVISCSPTNRDFSYNQEINVLIEAVSRPLTSFVDVVAPCISSSPESWEPDTTDKALTALEVDMIEIVIQSVEAMRKDVDKYLHPLSTLLLLYMMEVLSSQPCRAVTEEELTDLQNMWQTTRIPAVRDLEQLTELVFDKTSSIETQQSCLMSMRHVVQHHWQLVRMTMHGP
ncbi:hypothetical protein GGR58DRAFT_496631 [Xylaria digitata]|nr:hypothetical protein GGR58DRAFT_496631 [Xylaria digitata]